MRDELAGGAIGINLGKKKPGSKSVRYANISRMIAARIRICRELRGMSQGVLEDAAGTGRGHVSRIESGERGRSLSIDMVVSMAHALRVDLLWLITGQGRSPFGLLESEAKQQTLPLGALAPQEPSSKALKTPGKASPQHPPKRSSPEKQRREQRRPARPEAGAPERAKAKKRKR